MEKGDHQQQFHVSLRDGFDKGWGRYTFNTYCNEDKNLQLDDGVTKVFLNVNGDKHRVSRELANLMEYIATGKVEDEFTGKLESAVESLRADDGKERLYMTFQQTIMEHEMMAEQRGEIKGRAEGVLEQLKKTVLRMFKRNTPIEDIADMNDISVEQVKEICKASH